MSKASKIAYEVNSLSEPILESHLFGDEEECKRILELIHELTADIRSDLPGKSVQWNDDGKPYICEG